MLQGASKGELENEFGTSNEDDAVLKILEKGSLQEFEVWATFLLLFFPLFTPVFFSSVGFFLSHLGGYRWRCYNCCAMLACLR